jgi:uncharacterized membrane protein YhhN
MKNTVISFLYFLNGILFLIFKPCPSFLPAFILKSLIIPFLAVLFLTNLHPTDNLLHKLILAGAILFVLSDSAIAVNKFGCHFSGSATLVMLAYLAAQYLIITGYIRQYRDKAV